jgi:hypothetical protein
MYVCMCVCMCVCVCVYIYESMCVHTYTYIYPITQTRQEPRTRCSTGIGVVEKCLGALMRCFVCGSVPAGSLHESTAHKRLLARHSLTHSTFTAHTPTASPHRKFGVMHGAAVSSTSWSSSGVSICAFVLVKQVNSVPFSARTPAACLLTRQSCLPLLGFRCQYLHVCTIKASKISEKVQILAPAKIFCVISFFCSTGSPVTRKKYPENNRECGCAVCATLLGCQYLYVCTSNASNLSTVARVSASASLASSSDGPHSYASPNA